MTRVSVIIPTYNASSTLEATLLSAANALTLKDEIIVVDDHSQDNGFEMAQRILARLPIQGMVQLNPGKGACQARNHGLTLSKGKWVQWLDADDLIHTSKVNRALEHLETNPTQLVACPWHPFIQNMGTDKLEDDVDWGTIPSVSTAADWLARDTFMGLHCYMGQRTLFEAAGPWDASLSINQDGEYFARVVAQSDGVLFTQDTHVYYRRASSGSVSQFKPEKADSLFRSTESMERTALSLEDSHRMRQMVANRWQHLIYTVYPSRPDLIRAAKLKLKDLPSPNISNPNAVSPLSKLVSRTLGWKTLTHARLLRSKLTAS